MKINIQRISRKEGTTKAGKPKVLMSIFDGQKWYFKNDYDKKYSSWKEGDTFEQRVTESVYNDKTYYWLSDMTQTDLDLEALQAQVALLESRVTTLEKGGITPSMNNKTLPQDTPVAPEEEVDLPF